MEPPAKRLRMLQARNESGEPDAGTFFPENSREKAKSAFEAIFARFENLPDEDQDEIDLQTLEITVDRGHVRRMKERKAQAIYFDGESDKIDLDRLARPEGYDSGHAHAQDSGSDDELAPPPSEKPLPKKTAPATPRVQVDQATITANPHFSTPLPALPSQPSSDVAGPANPAQMTAQAFQIAQPMLAQQQQPNVEELAAFGQAIWTQMAQFIGRFGANAAPNTPPAPQLTSTPAATPTVALIAGPSHTPATDPKWYAPPLPPRQPRTTTFRSSPPISRRTSPPAHVWSAPTKRAKQGPRTPKVVADRAANHTVRDEHVDRSREQEDDPLYSVRQHRRSLKNCKYQFTLQDDRYIIEQKEVRGLSWKAVRQGRKEWRAWPDYAVSQYYTEHLKERDWDRPAGQVMEAAKRGHLQNELAVDFEEEDCETNAQPHDQTITPASIRKEQQGATELYSHNLPTPTASIRPSTPDSPTPAPKEVTPTAPIENTVDIDVDVMDILSNPVAEARAAEDSLVQRHLGEDQNIVVSADVQSVDEVHMSPEAENIFRSSPLPDEALPSVESETPISECLEDNFLIDAPWKSDAQPPETPGSFLQKKHKTGGKSSVSTPHQSSARKAKNIRPIIGVQSDEDDISLVGDSFSITMHKHTPEPAIKQEPTSPHIMSLSAFTPTQKPAVPLHLGSSGAKSSTKISRKALNAAKATWSRGIRAGTPTVKESRELLKRKRSSLILRSGVDSGSDDELA